MSARSARHLDLSNADCRRLRIAIAAACHPARTAIDAHAHAHAHARANAPARDNDATRAAPPARRAPAAG